MSQRIEIEVWSRTDAGPHAGLTAGLSSVGNSR